MIDTLLKADHDFLDNDVCKAFLRRIKVLNRHAVSISGKFPDLGDRVISVDHRNLLRTRLARTNMSGDDDIALSCRWRKDPSSKKWSRDDTVWLSALKNSIAVLFDNHNKVLTNCKKQHIKRSCSTPINNRPGAGLKKWSESDS